MKSTRSLPRRPFPYGPSSRRLAAAVTGVGLLILAAAGCTREKPRPDVLLVTIDTLRRDHCSLYGYPVRTTPHLDALAARGVRFDDAYAESATTAPSHAVLMTGRHFRSTGVTKNGAAIPSEDVTLAETLRASGWQTAGFVSSYPLLTRFGFSQGFDAYDDNFEVEQASIGRRKQDSIPHDRYAGATLEHATRWLAANSGEKPLFLWVHYVDPHAPYKAPEKFDAKWPAGTPAQVKRYDGEVHYADEQLGRLLAMLEEKRPGRERLIVVTSDHGEGLGDHGWQSHGINLYQEAVRVPLVMAWTGRLPAGKVVAEPVGLVDIARSVLGLLAVDAPTFTDGQDLFAVRADRPVFLQRRDYHSQKEKGVEVSGEMTAIVQSGAKFLMAPDEGRRELYDLAKDPGELADLLGGAKPLKAKKQKKGGAAKPASPPAPAPAPTPVREAEARRLEKELDSWRREFPPARTSEAPMDKESLKALRSLGYVD